MTTPVHALTSAQIKAFESGVRYFNTEEDTCPNSGGLTQSSSTKFGLTDIATKYGLQSATVKSIGGGVLDSFQANQSPAKVASVLKLIIADAFISGQPDLGSSVTVTAQENYTGAGGGDGSVNSPHTGQSIKLGDALEQTLKFSSDTDANVLIDAAGGLHKINDTAHALGYTSTTILSYYNDAGQPTIAPNQTTVADLTKALEKIYVSSEANYQLAHKYLHEETVTFGLGSDANKWGGTSKVTGNAGVFLVGAQKYIITLYVEKDWLGDRDGSNPASGASLIKNATNDLVAKLTALSSTPAASGGSSCCSSQTSTTNLLGADNIEKAYRYLVQKGLSNEQAAGVMGNLIEESHLDPFAQEGKKTPPKGGYGIAQWTGTGAQNDPAGSRRIDLIKAMQDAGFQVNLTTQTSVEPPEKANELLSFELDYLWKTATDRGDIDAMKKVTTIDEAVTTWERRYEGAGTPRPADRLRSAHNAFDQYSNSSPGTSSTGTSSNCSGLVGDKSKFVDGFLIYSQYDPAWKDHPYSTSTIGDSGCGPSAMAMIITALTGSRVTPIDTADYAASENLYIAGVGSSHSIGPKLAEHWGLQSKSLSADVAQITEALRAGQLVIAPGKGSEPFTAGGHFIVIRGVLTNGNWKVGDSAHDDTSAKEWDPAQITASIKANGGGGVYAISK